jgi:hypothetical protein
MQRTTACMDISFNTRKNFLCGQYFWVFVGTTFLASRVQKIQGAYRDKNSQKIYSRPLPKGDRASTQTQPLALPRSLASAEAAGRSADNACGGGLPFSASWKRGSGPCWSMAMMLLGTLRSDAAERRWRCTVARVARLHDVVVVAAGGCLAQIWAT